MTFLSAGSASSSILATASIPAADNWPMLLGWMLALAILAISLRIYGRLMGRLIGGYGKVTAESFGLPDLLVVLVLGCWLGGLAFHGFAQKGDSAPMTNTVILNSALLIVIIVGGLAFFMRSRQIPLIATFGFRRVPFWRAFGLAFGLLAAAYPLVLLGTELMMRWLGDGAESQKIVEFFSEASKESDLSKVLVAAGVGIFVAPLAEEFIFRGYIYGVLRRYLGPLTALVLNAALFAAIHFNLLALPSLFLLAICFTLAYEATGSLLVPMMMHAMFNAVTLVKVFGDSFLSQ